MKTHLCTELSTTPRRRLYVLD